MKTWYRQWEFELGAVIMCLYVERDYPGRVFGLNIEGHRAHPNEWCDNPAYFSVSLALFGFVISASVSWERGRNA